MPPKRLNGGKKNLFLKFTYRIFFFNLKFFLSLCLVAKKMEENHLCQHH